MTAVLAGVALALVAALVVLVDVKPWRRPPVLTVTIRVDTSGFDEALRRAVASASVMGAAAAARVDEPGRVLWRDAYLRTRDLPVAADPCPFPRLRLWRWLP